MLTILAKNSRITISKVNFRVYMSKGELFMKPTGYIRRIDKLGRIVLPKDLRNFLDVKSDVDSVEIFTDDDKVIIKKYNPPLPNCIFCGSTSNVIDFKEQNICSNCLNELIEALND